MEVAMSALIPRLHNVRVKAFRLKDCSALQFKLHQTSAADDCIFSRNPCEAAAKLRVTSTYLSKWILATNNLNIVVKGVYLNI
jgi:hypothetical protein